MTRSFVRLGVPLALFLAAGWLYAWAPRDFGRRWIVPGADGFYGELAQALGHGHLALARQPDSRLVALPDPYDPARNAAFRVDNLSYYRGQYFLYPGILPAAVAFLPVLLLTGRHLTPEGASVGFCLLGGAAAVGVLVRLRRRSFPQAPGMVYGAALLAVLLASGFQIAAGTSLTQSVAVAGGYACALAGIWAATRADGSPTWIAAASFCLAAAAGCRPNYIVGAGLTAALLGWLYGVRPGKARGVAAALLPLLAVAAALAAYNFLRFGNPMEFGQHYLLGEWEQRRLPALSIAGARLNAWTYLFSPAAYNAYFPFVTLLNSDAAGVLRNVPWLWLAPVAAWGLTRTVARGAPRRAAAACLLVGGANLLTLVFLPTGSPDGLATSANDRYLLDFLPEAVLAVAIGTLAAAEAWSSRRAARRGLAAGALLVGVASAAVGLSLNFQRFPSESYRPLAGVMDFPAFLLDHVRGDRFGPVRATVVFPAHPKGSYEPLLETGGPNLAELLYVHYLGPGLLQFGLVRTGATGPLSPSISVTTDQPHLVTISMGCLYPPAGYPGWPRLTATQVAWLQRTLRIEIDGKVAFEAPAYFPPAPPGTLKWGRLEFIRGYSSESFSGRITGSSRLGISAPIAAPAAAASYGALRLTLKFPLDRSGHAEPLVATGVAQAGDIVFVRYLDSTHLQLGVDHWGSPLAQTPALPIDYASVHLLELSMGSLLPASALADGRRISVRLDGRAVLDLPQATYGSSPYDVRVGYNVIGASSCDYAFTGRILRQARIPAGERRPDTIDGGARF